MELFQKWTCCLIIRPILKLYSSKVIFAVTWFKQIKALRLQPQPLQKISLLVNWYPQVWEKNLLQVGFIYWICDGNDRTYNITCLVNIPGFKRFLVLKKFFKFGDIYLETRFLNLKPIFLSGNVIFKVGLSTFFLFTSMIALQKWWKMLFLPS